MNHWHSRSWRRLGLGLGLAVVAFLLTGCPFSSSTPIDRDYLTVLGHRSVMQPGSQVEVPLVVRRKGDNAPQPDGQVRVLLGQTEETAQELFSGVTDETGLVTARFTVPRNLDSPNQYLIITSKTVSDQIAYSQPVYVGTAYNVLVSTDKPMYQPGQTIHVRVLALDSRSLRPAAGQAVRVVVAGPNQIALADETVTLSDWGIGSVDVELGPRSAVGHYTISAAMKFGDSSRTIEVKPYAVPRFKIEVHTDQAYYLTDGVVSGTVQASYVFGKPVAGAVVHLSGWPDYGHDEVLALDGVTAEDGSFPFRFAVPDYFFDRLTDGAEQLELTATVTDTAGRAEQTGRTVVVAASPLIIEAVPESGYLVPGLENLVYVQVSTPAGEPVQANLRVDTGAGRIEEMQTDAYGLATTRLTREGAADIPITITAQAGDLSTMQVAELGMGYQAGVLLRSARAEYQVGESIDLECWTTAGIRRVYLDIVKDRQTVDFRTLEVIDGHASASVIADGSLLGTLEIHAYAQATDGSIVSDERLVLINPAPAQVDVQAEATSYRPGDTAHLRLDVSRQGEPLPSALGISIVDDSLPSGGAQNPSFVRSYFLIRDEMLERRYRINGFAPFGDDRPWPWPWDGIQFSANTALMAAFAQTLADEAAIARQATSIAPATTATSPAVWGWLPSLLMALPVGSVLLWGGRPRRRTLLLASAGILALVLLLLGCSASAPSAPGVQERVVPGDRSEAKVPTGPAQGPAAIAPSQPRLRQFFPETLLWMPEIVTDATGHVEIDVPIADSITTWRVNVVASAQDGTLGSAQRSLKAFQDFFVEPSMPARLTQNDVIEVPVAVYNYSTEPQRVELGVRADDWFEAPEDRRKQTVSLAPAEAGVVHVPIKVLAPGQHELVIDANSRTTSDSISRVVQVAPDGRRVVRQVNGLLARSAEVMVDLPADRLTQTAQVVVDLYPDPTSQFSMQVPEGYEDRDCFYADLSGVQPVAVLHEYLNEIGQFAPADRLRAGKLLRRGYQRLLRYYDSASGGFTGDCFFSTLGEPDVPATAAALVALNDLKRVTFVDPALIENAIDYLATEQQQDGAWPASNDQDAYGYGAQDELHTTAQVAMALAEAGLAKSELTQQALGYLRGHLDKAESQLTQALIANAFLLSDKQDPTARRLIEGLLKRSTVEDGQRVWRGAGGYDELDTTALMALALLRSGRYPDEAQETLRALNPYSYVSTVELRAMLLNARQRPSVTQAEVTLDVNGQAVDQFVVTPQNRLTSHQVILAPPEAPLQAGENQLRLRSHGDAVMRYQVTTEYYAPWPPASVTLSEPVSLRVLYTQHEAQVGDVLDVSAVIHNQTVRRTGPMIVELAVPAGFEVVWPDWWPLADKGVLRDFQVQSDVVVVYLDDLAPGKRLVLDYQLRAVLVGAVRVPVSRIHLASAAEDAAEFGASEVLTTRQR